MIVAPDKMRHPAPETTVIRLPLIFGLFRVTGLIGSGFGAGSG